MKRGIVVPILVSAIGISACGHSAKNEANTPQARQAEAKAQKLVQACAFSGGKRAVESCLQKHGVTQKCAERNVQGANFLTHKGRQQFLVKLEGCAR